MTNGHDKTPNLIIPVPVTPPVPPGTKNCHRFFAPVVFPEPDKLDPRKANITPRLGNFGCIKANCMLWNEEAGECWDVSAARGLAQSGEYAYAMRNDVTIPDGGK